MVGSVLAEEQSTPELL
jgi:hypothetical protein